MARVRVSTTVDAQRWATARRLLDAPSSQIMDRALAALIAQLETAQERAALATHPYDDDPDLDWEAPSGPALPYEGDVPAEVRELAERRRREARQE